MSETNKKAALRRRLKIISRILTAVTMLGVCFGLSYAAFVYTPLKHVIPGYPGEDELAQKVEMTMKMDSLERSIRRWELYSENLRNVLSGGKGVTMQSIIDRVQADSVVTDPTVLKQADSLLRASVAEDERFEVSSTPRRNLHIEGLHFFTPVNGAILKGFDNATHPYIDVAASEGSIVYATLDGSVIYTQWDEETGWCIILQHNDDIISIYRHGSALLKKVADKVSAGSPICMLGANGTDEDCHLQFELWQSGEPVDASVYINF